MSDVTSAILQVRTKMREQIKELQEKRAATMMNEIAELQRERDIALSKLKQMEKVISELQEENLLLKENCRKEADLKIEIKSLKQLLLENKHYINDLKKKLQSSEKKKNEMSLKLQSSYSPMVQQRSNLLQVRDSNISQSTGDLRTNLDDHTRSPMPSPTPSPFSSPSLITRRYKLFSVQTCHKETQTENQIPSDSTLTRENLPHHVLETLAAARNDILKLQNQNQELVEKINKHKINEQKYKIIQQECNVLHESHSQFSQWVQHKLSSVEEEMDICKVVYSLHGSLSQETKTIEELREKVVKNELTINHLKQINEHLTASLAQTETRLSNSQNEAKALKKQLEQAMKSSVVTERYRLNTLTLPSPLLKQKTDTNN